MLFSSQLESLCHTRQTSSHLTLISHINAIIKFVSPDEIDIEANALQIMATSVMVAVSDALDDFMSSLEKFNNVVKLEFTCMRRSYGAKIYLTLQSVEHHHCICGGKVKVRTIGEVMILQNFSRDVSLQLSLSTMKVCITILLYLFIGNL